jgi:cytochrome c oxidase subunit III
LSGHNESPPTVGGRTGMWLFIATEVLLFGGLFLLYSMYRLKNPVSFHAGSLELSRFFGTLNTVILITSSFTIALAIHALRENKIKKTGYLIISTIGCAFCFLIVKAFEWSEKFEHGLYPKAAALMAKPKGEILYFGLYFMMTGLHAVHVIVGIGVLSAVLIMIRRGKVTAVHPLVLENAGLYWHLVDVIWIFLFPLFYLIS